MPTEPDENLLLRRAHDGDAAALEALYAQNLASARRLAVILAGPAAAEDLVADAFARVLAQIRAGRGPVDNFRGYLFATIRNRHRDLLRRSGREAPVSDEPWLLEGPTESVEDLVQELDEGAAVAALGSLPDRWQRVLWHLEVEGHQVPEVATMLSMSPAAVSSLAYRAREGLKVAYLEHHLPRTVGGASCAWARQRLGAYVRGGLSARAGARLDEHLSACTTCAAAATDLQQVNKKLAALVVPILLLGGAGAGLLDAGGPSGSSGPGPGPGATTMSRVAHPGRALRVLGTRGASGAGTGVATGTIALVALGAAALVVGVVLAAWWAFGHDAEADDRATPAPTGATATGVTEPGATDAATDPLTPSSTTTPPATDTTTTPTTEPTPTSPTDATAAPTETATATAGTATAAAAQPGKLGAARAVAVRPMAPTATPISACGSYGSLAMPQTTGVDYVLTQGDGRQGAWVVTGQPRSGYVLAPDAQRRFTGDLGAFYPCPALGALSLTDLGGGAWRLGVPVSAAGPGSYPLIATVTMDSETLVPAGGVTGAGWTCRGPDPADPQIGAGTEYLLPAGFAMSCRFEYAGSAPPDLAITMRPNPVGPVPTGTVTLTADGTPRGSAGY